MDQELIHYLDGRFGHLDERFDGIDVRFARIDERFERIDERFERIDERFGRIDERFGRIEQRLDGHDEQFRRMNERFDELKRHTGVLVEGLRHDIQVVAEGFVMHTQVQHAREREYHDRQHEETRALIRSVYDELRGQR